MLLPVRAFSRLRAMPYIRVEVPATSRLDREVLRGHLDAKGIMKTVRTITHTIPIHDVHLFLETELRARVLRNGSQYVLKSKHNCYIGKLHNSR